VTTLMPEDISWSGFDRGMLAPSAAWWAWACYTWLTDAAPLGRPTGRLVIILAMASMLVAARPR
jgi:low temperature requirement protein LtrA